MEQNEMMDATGQPIEMGRRYSTISKHRGADTQVIGIAKTVSKLGQIGLHIERRLELRRNPNGKLPAATYQDMSFGDWGFEKRTVSYHPGVLFPVSSEPASVTREEKPVTSSQVVEPSLKHIEPAGHIEPSLKHIDRYKMIDIYMSGQYD